jgi:hypothetical protein
MRRSRRKGMEAGADELTWWGMKGEGKERIYKTKGRRTLRKKRLCKNQVKWRDGICFNNNNNNTNNIALCFLTLYAADYDIRSQSWDTEREIQWE